MLTAAKKTVVAVCDNCGKAILDGDGYEASVVELRRGPEVLQSTDRSARCLGCAQPKAKCRDISTLAESFHQLRGAPGVRPFNALQLQRWALGPGGTDGSVAAVQFVLSIFAPGRAWRVGKFDLQVAMACWDSSQLNAFLDWAQDPWWP